MTAAAIWAAAFPLLAQIGRWVLNRVSRVGAARIGAYMLERAAGAFQARIKNAHKVRRTKRAIARRIAWLKGRIRRWTALGQWLLEHATDVDAARAALRRLAVKHKVPLVGALEAEPA